MFRDVPECSGMFRNVPCSGFYRRPFPSAKLKMAVAAVKVIWVPSDDKTGESEVGANSNINALLTCLLFEFCETLLVACSKRSDSGERCEVKIAINPSPPPSLLFFSRSFLLRIAPHCLNAWNRLRYWILVNKISFWKR